MPYKAAVIANITRNLTSAQGATFNFPIFCASHNYFKERVRSYSSIDAFRADANIPAHSPITTAVTQMFSQQISPEIVYVGRRQTDDIKLVAVDIADAKAYGLTIEVFVKATRASVSTTVISITSAASATATTIAAQLATPIAGISNVTATAATGVVTISADSTHDVIITKFVRTEETYTTTETASTLLAAIQVESNDWYFMTADDHTEAFQLAMALAIEPTGSSTFPKMYFTSSQSVDSIVTLPDPAIEVGGKLKEFKYDRSNCDWHNKADSIYPECALVGANGTYKPGTITWKFTQLKGVPSAADPVTGIKLGEGAQGFIKDRNMGWMGDEMGVSFYHEGDVASGEFIDTIRGADWLKNLVKLELMNLMLNQRGGKISYAKPAKVLNTINSCLDIAVGTGFLDGYKPAVAPDYLLIPFATKVSRILEDVNWTGFIAGAVHNIITNGNLTFEQK